MEPQEFSELWDSDEVLESSDSEVDMFPDLSDSELFEHVRKHPHVPYRSSVFGYMSDSETEESEQDYLKSSQDSAISGNLLDGNSSGTSLSDGNRYSWFDAPSCAPHNFPFTGEAGMTERPSGYEPHDFFNLVFTDEFFQWLVREINELAKTIFFRGGWEDTSIPEIKRFLALLFNMGVTHIDSQKEYWSTSPILWMPFFHSQMSRDRWLSIQRVLDFAPNPRRGHPLPFDALVKIRPLIAFFHIRMAEIINPGKEVCINESVALRCKRAEAYQYMPSEYHDFGIKLYMLTEPDGLIHRFLINSEDLDSERGHEYKQKLVIQLMDGLLNQGRSLYLDAQCTSVDLTAFMLNVHTYVNGNLDRSTKHNPLDIATIELRKGELIQKWSQNGINIAKWRGRGQHVMTISSEFSSDLMSGPQNRKKPRTVLKNNTFKNGIVHVDKNLTSFITTRRSLPLYKNLAYHIFEIMLHNAFTLYSRFTVSSRPSIYPFRLAIIEYLCDLTPSHSVNDKRHLP